MTVRRILMVIGILAMAAGALEMFRPRSYWAFWENLLVGQPFNRPTEQTYIVGGVALVLGLFLLYVGLRKLTLFSTLIRAVAVLGLAAGLLMVFAQDAFRDLLDTIIYGRSEWARMVMGYLGGIIKFFIGVLFVIAGLKRLREEQPAPAATPDSTASRSLG